MLDSVRPDGDDKDVVIRLRVGTEDWKRVMLIARYLKKTPTECARWMLRTSFKFLYRKAIRE